MAEVASRIEELQSVMKEQHPGCSGYGELDEFRQRVEKEVEMLIEAEFLIQDNLIKIAKGPS